MVYGHTGKEHDLNIKRVLARSHESDIKLNTDELEVGLSQVHYFGDMITSEGLKPDQEKIAAVKQTIAYRDREELDTIFDIIDYFVKFAPKLSEINNPMC